MMILSITLSKLSRYLNRLQTINFSVSSFAWPLKHNDEIKYDLTKHGRHVIRKRDACLGLKQDISSLTTQCGEKKIAKTIKQKTKRNNIKQNKKQKANRNTFNEVS